MPRFFTVRTRLGVSLVEALVAAFMLLGGFVVTARLLHAGLRYSNHISSHLEAVRLGQRRLGEVRAWSRSNHQPVGSTAFSSWAGIDGVLTVYPEAPSFRLTTTVPNTPLYSPCSLFEKVYDPVNPGLKRDFTGSLRQVVVVVDWGGPLKVTLTTVVGAPSSVAEGPFNLSLAPVGTTGAGAQTLHHNDVVTYRAELRDASSNVVPDVSCDWAVVGAGNGQVTPSRTAPQASFQHRIQVAGIDKYLDGRNCRLQAAVRYRGAELRALSPLLQLTP